MNNLFVLHTQYNLVLAIGLCKTDFRRDNNELILFNDFKITNKHQENIDGVFNNAIILQGSFPKREMTSKMKMEQIDSDNNKTSTFISRKYDRVFIVEDMCIQEMYIMKCTYKINNDVQFCWLEDGATAYYRNGVVSGGMGGTPIKRLIRKAFFSIKYGLGSFYDLNEDTGTHRKISSIYVIYPDQVIDIYKTKVIRTISEESFNQGMRLMYAGDEFIFPEGSALIAMDLLANYKDKKNMICRKILDYLMESQIPSENVFIKYHPRETEAMLGFENFNELDRTIGMESYLTNSQTKNLTVIGIMSTSLLSAKKMGFTVVSLANSTGFASENLAKFYKKIEIKNI